MLSGHCASLEHESPSLTIWIGTAEVVVEVVEAELVVLEDDRTELVVDEEEPPR